MNEKDENGNAVERNDRFSTNGVPFSPRFLIVRRPFYGTEFETFFFDSYCISLCGAELAPYDTTLWLLHMVSIDTSTNGSLE